ncbi:MAG: class I SAM-dependent methyltransferase [Hyphomicrobiaceae bacterium]|nr:class I SAM-dependent methyltransferase [Hyphomicrobiaceae bacterium]
MGDRPDTQHDHKQHAPAAARNAASILDVLTGCLPKTGAVLEIASGTGQHAAAFAQALPHIAWQPSDRSENARASIRAWREEAGAENLEAPVNLDVMDREWPKGISRRFDAIVAINLIHVAPWAALKGLLKGSGQLLAPGGFVYLYGPFKQGGEHTAPSNARFDLSLRAQDPEWGVRDIDNVEKVGAEFGLQLERVIEMPANNFSLILRRG